MNETLSALTLIVTAVYAFLTYKIMSANHATVEMMKAQITSSIRPFVYFDLTTDGPLIEGVLKNTGRTAANNISVTLTPPVKNPAREVSPNPVLLNSPVSFLPPEKEVREFMGSFNELELGNPNLKFIGEITYFDSAGTRFHEKFEIELNSRKSMPYISKTMVSTELEKTNSTLKDLVRALGKATTR